VDDKDKEEAIGPIQNNKLNLIRLEKDDLMEYCETKIKYFLDLVQRLISMKSLLGKFGEI
jgi:hypothetical protein